MRPQQRTFLQTFPLLALLLLGPTGLLRSCGYRAVGLGKVKRARLKVECRGPSCIGTFSCTALLLTSGKGSMEWAGAQGIEGEGKFKM
jgi:hypothetical protein